MSIPKIRHCRNCAWHKTNYLQTDNPRTYDCRVRYKSVYFERITALLCKYYKQEEEPSETEATENK